MLEPQNKIIIVDDNPEHLSILSKPFYELGIGCKCYKYNSLFDKPLTGVRIAFFDIRLNPSGGGSDNQRMNDLANAIQSYISKDNGPFALIFWTSNPDEVSSIKKHITDRVPDCPKPFVVKFIDKDEFINTEQDLVRLPKKLKSILGAKTIKALFSFENAATVAAAKTINRLYNIVPSSDTWGESDSFNENFEKVFSKVAIQSLGYNHAKENPDKAIYEALVPVLSHEILSSKKNNGTWKEQLVLLTSSQKASEIAPPEGFKRSQLNTIFHIDNTGLKSDARGVVLKMKKGARVIQDTFNLTYDNWVKSFIPFNKDFKAGVKEESEKSIKRLIEGSDLVVIEISAACDYQQNRDRLNKYLYGVRVDPINDGLLNKQHSDSSMKVGIFFIEGKEFEIWVNLNYVFGALATDKRLGKPLFLFRKEMMDQIGNRYANHVSRIGITSF